MSTKTESNKITIPHPDNPGHVENLISIDLLEAQGFEGSDADLAISLFEYGLVWRLIGDEYLFVHRHPSRREAFERSTVAARIDCKVEYDWVKWPDIYSFTGMTENEWHSMLLPQRISDLVNYYGEAEIFGSSYWEGFKVAE